MATGFEKMKNKIMDESPITLNPGKKDEQKETSESRQVIRMTRVSRVGETQRVSREEPAARDAAQKVMQPEEKEKLFQITIKIRPSTKDKLDWLKFSQKKKFMELAEEAFEDIYNKYKNQ